MSKSVTKAETQKRGAGNLGQSILRMRRARGWTQDDLAEKTKIARITISRLESGSSPGARSGTTAALCAAFGCSEADLYRAPSSPKEGAADASQPAGSSERMTAEEFVARHGRSLLDNEKEAFIGYGRTRPGAVHHWTEADWMALAMVIRTEFPPKLG